MKLIQGLLSLPGMILKHRDWSYVLHTPWRGPKYETKGLGTQNLGSLALYRSIPLPPASSVQKGNHTCVQNPLSSLFQSV